MVGKTNTMATGGDERQVPRHNFMFSILDALLLAPSPESVRHQSLFPCPPRVNSRVSRADTNEWYKATISAYLRHHSEAARGLDHRLSYALVRGKTAYAIYQIENGTLIVSGNEPGIPTVPAGFDASGARKLVFKQQ